MKENKIWLSFKRIIIFLFILFLINYFSVKSGYYESKIRENTIITEEKIKEFEEDVKNGNYVDLKDYTESDYVDTSNKLNIIGYKLGEGVDDFINNKVTKILKTIGNLFK